MGTVVERTRLMEMPIAGAVTDDMWLYVVDPTVSAVINRSQRASAPVAAAYFGAAIGIDATFITQTPNAALANEQPLSALASGVLRSTTTTGVVSIDAPITSIADLVTAADQMLYTTAADTYAVTDLTAFARTILDDANQATVQTTLSLVPGTDVQAYDAQLDDIAALAVTDGNFIVGDGANWVAESGATARSSLGLGSMAIINDAPSDGTVYGRQNGAWAAAGGGGGLPVTDDTIITQGNVDNTKQMRFENDTLISAGNTRVMTIPDTDQVLAGRNVNNSFSVGQLIDGTADEVQLTVQANATQTANILEWEDSAGNVLGGVDERGVLFCDLNIDADSLYLGADAGNLSHTNAVDNTGIGKDVLQNLTTGDDNTAVGYRAIWKATEGYQNTAIGSEALYLTTTGYRNVAIGFQTLRANTTGYANMALGWRALTTTDGAHDNVAIGYDTLYSTTSGNGNMGIGAQALRSNTTGKYNTGIGLNAGRLSTTVDNNTAIGYQALYTLNAGTNVAVGNEAGYSIAGSDNVCLGYRAGYSEAGSNKLYISNSNTATPLIYGEFDNKELGINIGSGCAATLHVDQDSSTGAKPVLLLDQADIDLEFIKFVGSSEDSQADRSLVDAADMTTPGALTGWIQVYIEDVQATNPITDGVYYIPFYAAPSA